MLSLLDAPTVPVALNRLVKDGLRRNFARAGLMISIGGPLWENRGFVE